MTKIIQSSFLMSAICSFRSIKSKYDVDRGKDSTKKFSDFL